MDKVVNLKLLAHPVNWLIVWTVILFGGFAWKRVHDHLSAPATPIQ